MAMKAVLVLLFGSVVIKSLVSCDGNSLDQDTSSAVFELNFLNQVSSVKFRLYTRRNPTKPQEIFVGDRSILVLSNYDEAKPTKVIIHGYVDIPYLELWLIGRFTAETKDAFLATEDANVIAVDWSRNAFTLYSRVVSFVPEIGRQISNMLDWLITLGTSPDSFHLVGHSTGAQLTASTSRQMKNGRISHITGLDPAGPIFEVRDDGLRSSDAEYVEIIHTDTRLLGTSEPRGHNDFYPNWGSRQPGCLSLNYYCSHIRAVDLFVESLLSPGAFLAVQCESYEEIARKSCSGLGRLNMGGSEPKEGVGVFYLETNSNSPFSMS